MKKRTLALLLALTMVCLLFTGCSSDEIASQTGGSGGSGGDGGDKVVDVYNWGEYIDDSIFEDFTAETGIKVNYTTFATNEEMYAKLKSGSAVYDVVIPSDYMISRMIEEDMLEPINFDNVPNFSKIDARYKNPVYDPEGKFSVPYMWGTVGIIYNSTMVDEEITSWSALFDEKYADNILMFDNSRDAIGIALKYLGYSYNTTDKKQLQEAQDLLKQQKPLVQAYVMDQIFDKMIAGEAAIGPYYAGDYMTMLDENPDLKFCLPEEGSNLFVDAMCIPKGALHKDAAEAFINFMCSDDAAVANAEEIYYSTPSTDALALLDAEERESEILYPSAEVLDKCETFENLPADILKLYDEIWVSVKSE